MKGLAAAREVKNCRGMQSSQCRLSTNLDECHKKEITTAFVDSIPNDVVKAWHPENATTQVELYVSLVSCRKMHRRFMLGYCKVRQDAEPGTKARSIIPATTAAQPPKELTVAVLVGSDEAVFHVHPDVLRRHSPLSQADVSRCERMWMTERCVSRLIIPTAP